MTGIVAVGDRDDVCNIAPTKTAMWTLKAGVAVDDTRHADTRQLTVFP